MRLLYCEDLLEDRADIKPASRSLGRLKYRSS